ncbi:MAG: glycosyltransferase [Lachnospiraceae bacterium]|nr:glycosyltransferase [Lachnospiraceae bacterium]
MDKILFHLNSLEQGGAERVVSNLANQFVKENYEVIVATQWQGEDEFQLDSRVRRIHVGMTEQDAKKNRIRKALLRIWYLRKCIKTENPDIVIAFAHKANYRALTAAIGLKIPVVISIRTDPKGHYDSLLDKIQIPLLFPRAAGCVFQTEGQREFFPQYLQQKSRIILNPVNDKYLNTPKVEVREKTVVQSGRLVDFKNQPMLLKAFLKVHEKHPDYDLKIYGPDSFDGTKEILEKIIKENHAERFIHLMGGSDELEKQLPKAAVYAFSSDWEGLPNALLEAMALGMPIVATDCPCGGPKTVIVDGENGLLVPIKDQNAMADGINRLIEDREFAERLGENARKISEKINSVSILAQWRDYIEEIILEK